MDNQTLINILLGLVAFFVGVLVRELYDSHKESKKVDSSIAGHCKGKS